MSLSLALQVLLPTIVPIIAGYALARWVGLNTQALASVARYVFLPALLFTVLEGRMPLNTFLIVAATGVALAGTGLLVVRKGPRFLKQKIDASAATFNIACFSVPLLALSWASRGLGTACALFVGVTIMLVGFNSRGGWRALRKEPWLWAVIAALAFQEMGISVGALQKVVSPIAQASYPVLLVLLGVALHPFPLLRDARTWTTVGVRMAASFGVALLAIAALPFTASVAEGLVLVSLAPPATQAISLGSAADDGKAAHATSFIGTLASLAAVVALLVTGWKPWEL
jgi:predicted permease